MYKSSANKLYSFTDLFFSEIKFPGKLLCLLCLLLSAHNVFAGNQIRFDLLDTRHGLSNNNITYIYEDSQGYIWFGTREGGVNRFNGTSFEVFSHNTAGDGLTHNFITSITEDKNGMILMGTMGGGINYFNPNTLEIGNINSLLSIISYLPSKIIHCLFIDSFENLWIGSTSGLTRYSFVEQSFKTYKNEPGTDMSLISNKIHTITEFSPGTVLVGSENGLDFLDVESGYSKNLLKGFEVRSMLKSESGKIWIGSTEGLFELKSTDKIPGDPVKKNISILQGESISSMAEDYLGNIWVSIENKGVVVISSESEVLHNFYPDTRTTYYISDRNVNFIMIDESNTVWLGTNSAGVNVHSLHSKPFRSLPQFKDNIENVGSLNFTFLDSRERLWLATREGLHMYDKKAGTYRVLKLRENNNFTSVSELSDGSIVAGTFGSGVYFYDEARKTLIKKGFALQASLSDQKIWSVLDDKSGNIWLGTIGNGVFKFDSKQNLLSHFTHDERNVKTLANNFVKQIVKDNSGNIWFITNHQGVSMLKQGQGDFIRFLRDDTNPHSILDNSVDDIYVSESGLLYLSTYDGLCTYSHETGIFEKVVLSNSVKSPGIKAVLMDNDGNWWISKKDGIIKYNPLSGEYWEIDEIGIHFGEFKRSAIFQYLDGEIVVSGSNEVILFNPHLIDKNPVTPLLALTNLHINHEPVLDFSEGSVLQKPINITEKIVLNPRQRNFSVEFTCLNVFASGKTRFYYILEGYDKSWIDAGINQSATYTNLDPGSYTLRLKASNNDGVFGEQERSLNIVILPLWYNTWYFRILMVGIAIFAVIFLVRLRIASLKRQRVILERKVEEKTSELHFANEELRKQKQEILDSQATIVRKKEQLESTNHLLIERNKEIEDKNNELEEQKKKLEELSQTKNRFFANISHEFKTPLTLILGPLETLADRLKNEPDYLVYTELINKNSRRLLGLINQLLDISKIESGKMTLSLVQDDILKFTRSIYESFRLRSERLNIQYKFTSDRDQIEVFFDPDKVEKILFNLLSNAFKFTPTNGNIEVSVNTITGKDSSENYILIEVTDSGIGIPTDNLSKVFDYFTQIGQSNTGIQGSGIGLSLVKQMAEIHSGNVYITSEENKGTKVSVKLRVDSGIIETNELQIDDTVREAVLNDQFGTLADTTEGGIEVQPQYILNEEAPYVLVIEDNTDILIYVKDILKDSFNILTATEGCKGYEIAKNMVPDLIICDIMLPDSCGTEICERIKKNEITNHIPIIVLTALGSDENIYKGLEKGVDNYITKPFNPQMLKLRVNNLISTRKNLIERFKFNFLSNELQVLRSKTNENFVQKLVAIIEENIENPDFSNDDIAASLNVSTRQLYRKLEGIISMPLNKFMRHIKMKKAWEIMQSVPDLTISEIAYKVGFNDPKYFSKCFKEEFGSLPSELLKPAKP